MTVQPLQPSTYHNSTVFPSAPEDYFRAVVGSVTTGPNGQYYEVDASLQIGWAGSLLSLRFSTLTMNEGNPLSQYDRDQINQTVADLDLLHDEFLAFYAAAKSGFAEIPGLAPGTDAGVAPAPAAGAAAA